MCFADLLQLTEVPVGHPIIATDKLGLPGAGHAAAGLDLGEALLQGNLGNLLVTGQGEATCHLLQLATEMSTMFY